MLGANPKGVLSYTAVRRLQAGLRLLLDLALCPSGALEFTAGACAIITGFPCGPTLRACAPKRYFSIPSTSSSRHRLRMLLAGGRARRRAAARLSRRGRTWRSVGNRPDLAVSKVQPLALLARGRRAAGRRRRHSAASATAGTGQSTSCCPNPQPPATCGGSCSVRWC